VTQGNNQLVALDLARKQFGNLSHAELRLLRDAPRGKVAICGPSNDENDSSYDARNSDHWGPEREIRAEIIRWLCIDVHTRELVDPKGIWVFGAKIVGQLDLSHMKVPFIISLAHCRIVEDIDLGGLEIPELDLAGTRARAINVDQIRVNGSVFLTYPFQADGGVSLMGGQIGGDLLCNTAHFRNPPRSNVPGSGIALGAERMVVRGSVFLRNGFYAEGLVSLKGAEIGGDLDCTTAAFRNPAQTLSFGGGVALGAEHVVTKGSVYFRNGFEADGDVDLIGAQIGGNLVCDHSTILGELTAENVLIKGTFFWTGINSPESTTLDLINATVGTIEDDEKSWPRSGNLILDGFVYGRISGGPRDSKSRLRWIGRQKNFRSQPYTQLAKILNDQADGDGAKTVLVEMESKARATSWSSLPWSWLVKETTGYGYYPDRALWGLIVLGGLGWIIFRRAQLAGTMIPTDEHSCEIFKQTGHTPDHYPPFSPSLYSLENSLPLVKLGQTDSWQPDPNAKSSSATNRRWTARLQNWISSPRILRRFIVIQILIGWILATLFAAAVAGLIHKI